MKLDNRDGYTEYVVKDRIILKRRGMLFIEWCHINSFDYMIDELDWDFVYNTYGKNKDTLTQGFDKKCKWHCHKCGAEMNFKVVHRTNGHWNCPYCTGRYLDLRKHSVAHDLKHLLSEWDYERNTEKPEEVSSGSPKKYWWICLKGHSYATNPYHRKEGKGCPVCRKLKLVVGVNDLATTHPDLVKEWNYEANRYIISPQSITSGSKFKVWWKCSNGHDFEADINTRVTCNSGCPYCTAFQSSSFAETALYFYLDKIFSNIYRRYKLGGYEYDIYMPDEKIVIEYNGYHWHESDRKVELDNEKLAYARQHGLFMIIINSVRTSVDIFDIELLCGGVRITCFSEKKKPSSISDMVVAVSGIISEQIGISISSEISAYTDNIKKDFHTIERLITSDYGYIKGGQRCIQSS